MKSKAWWASKTIWVNALILLTGILGYVAGHELIVDHPSVVAMLVALSGALGVALRFLTWTPVKV